MTMIQALDTPALERACVALIARPARSLTLDSMTLGAMMDPPRPIAPLGAVLDLALAALEADGSVIVHFPSVGTYY